VPYTGRCLCGEVRYELDAELGPLVNCHCQFCRRAHGSAFSTVTLVPRSAFRITAGEALLGAYVGRRFCSRCATRLFNVAESIPDQIALVVASLEQEPTQAPALHLNLESKAPWYEILDDKPCFAGFPPGSSPGNA